MSSPSPPPRRNSNPVWNAYAPLYHEFTHAYLDLYEPQYSDEIQKGIEHYKGAHLADGTTVSNAERVFHEAIASYVGHRAAMLYMTQTRLDNLDRLLGMGLDVEAARAELKSIQDDYNSAMARRQF